MLTYRGAQMWRELLQTFVNFVNVRNLTVHTQQHEWNDSCESVVQ